MQLTINNLTLKYSTEIHALTEVNLSIGKGLYGLLGQNGAGKSSLMRILATLQEPTSGTVIFNDFNIHKDPIRFRQTLGYLPQEFGVYPTATAHQLLAQIADLKGIKDRSERMDLVDNMLQRVNLWDVRQRSMGSFSGGMRQRFGIAQALIAQPQVVIVDEPTAGLDPAERNRLYDLLAETGEKAIVILSTHLVEDVSTLCKHLTILGKGQILATGSPRQLKDSYRNRIWEKTILRSELDRYQQELPIISHQYVSGQLQITLLGEGPFPSSRVKDPTLEDVYFATLTNQRAFLANA
ncbi:ATP-binding cassette domain-containing protein [Spirosoma endophyticum]|uniref:ABC-type multidrug transport system, ATPase component n=1 Tax=Spirosoma endophyticum TaxID=662367 RepID=A0A1I2BK01_9BACT|nr:ATP-binding cassette domain-containing protein [Spirosoma endophyticum]SFE56522.1 ABC-type multidrug transport system, ATPase component [Spirosoma endophyticum]